MRTAGGRKENLYHLRLMFFCKKLYLVPAVVSVRLIEMKLKKCDAGIMNKGKMTAIKEKRPK